MLRASQHLTIYAELIGALAEAEGMENPTYKESTLSHLNSMDVRAAVEKNRGTDKKNANNNRNGLANSMSPATTHNCDT
jgi:hypothetical protein